MRYLLTMAASLFVRGLFVPVLALCLLALPLRADCTGAGFDARLTPQERATLETIVAETAFAEGLGFVATRGGQRLTLLGTIHIYDPRLAALRDRFRPAITEADLLLVEASAEDTAALEAYLAATPEILFLEDGPTLPEVLTEQTWDNLAEAATARQIPAFLAAKMQPWFLSLSLAIPGCAMADMGAGRKGLDFMLIAEAEAAGVPVQSLEPWREVLDLIRAGTFEEQIAELELGLLPADLQDSLFVTMLDLYVAGRITEVWEMSRIALAHVPGLDQTRAMALFEQTEQELLVDRNHNWMPVIAAAMADHDRVVVAVGAAHLPGADGILRLLERDGWQIAPL